MIGAHPVVTLIDFVASVHLFVPKDHSGEDTSAFTLLFAASF
jgi:hypothetical protein